MELLNLYSFPKLWSIPYDLLKEREPHQSISHKELPSWKNHCSFIMGRPYEAWYLIKTPQDEIAGCVYLTKNREIGIGILKKHRGNGYAEQAIRSMMDLHPGRFLANINPSNEASIRLFSKFGFNHIQNTYELECLT